MTENVKVKKNSIWPTITLLATIGLIAMLMSGPSYSDKEMMAFTMSQKWAAEQIPAGFEVTNYELKEVTTGTTGTIVEDTYFLEVWVEVKSIETGKSYTTAYTAVLYQEPDSEEMWYLDYMYFHLPEF